MSELSRHIKDVTEYAKLVSRVRQVDEDAADYLENEAILETDTEFSFAGNLSGCFIWSGTPQGSSYWSGIQMRASRVQED